MPASASTALCTRHMGSRRSSILALRGADYTVRQIQPWLGRSETLRNPACLTDTPDRSSVGCAACFVQTALCTF